MPVRYLTGLVSVVVTVIVIAIAWRAGRSVPPPLDLREESVAPITTGPEALVPGPPIRVCVSNREAAGRFRFPGGYRITAVGSPEPLASESTTSELKVIATSTGLQLGSRAFPVTRIELTPLDGRGFWWNDHRYRGTLRLFRQPGQKLAAVNVLPLEDYLGSVIDGEMPAAFPEAARQAQAVVARTYALAKMQQAAPESLWDVFASERSQKYLGIEYVHRDGRRLAGESAASRSLVAGTHGVVLTYQGRIFTTYYSAVCGGRTCAGTELFPDAATPHRSVPCSDCREAERFRWTATISADELRSALAELGRGRLTGITAIETVVEPGLGRIAEFVVKDGKRSAAVTAFELRQQLPTGTCLSPHFGLSLSGKSIKLEGRGHGHGVGLCQWGARGKAAAGQSWTEIVRGYYPGAEVLRLRY